MLVFLSCTSPIKKHKVTDYDFNWLCTNWVNHSDTSALFFENWTKINHNKYKGVSYVIASNDTVFFESIQLLNSDSGTFYQVAVKNQNEGKAVSFKLISAQNQTFIFENNNHDFPKKIGYQLISNDTLKAWIEGSVGGKHKEQTFLMWRKE